MIRPACGGFAKFPFPGPGALLAFTVANRVSPPITLTRTPASQTMPVGVARLITQFQVLWGEMKAVAAVYLLPVAAP